MSEVHRITSAGGGETSSLSNAMASSSRIVAVDIGGTHARFAIAELARGRIQKLGQAFILKTGDHAGFESAWEQFRQYAGPLPRAAAVAVAAPIAGDVVRLTNNHWTIRPASICDALGIDRGILLNDFAAVGHAVAQLDGTNFVHVCGPAVPLPAEGVISVVGPGTGLGVAYVRRGANGCDVVATAAGHIGFAPHDAEDDRILSYLRARYGQVSAERIVSGQGLAEICAALAHIRGGPVDPIDNRELWQRAMAGHDAIARAALDRFCRCLGSVAGDIALAQGAAATVIAGGLGLRLRDRLPASGFAECFVAKGPLRDAMTMKPVKLITHPEPGLFGAAAAFASSVAGPSSHAPSP